MAEVLYGKVVSVDTRNLGAFIVGDHLVDDTEIAIADTTDLEGDGGSIQILDHIYQYTDVVESEPGDEDADYTPGSITLVTPLLEDVPDETPVLLFPLSSEKTALVTIEDGGDGLEVTVPHDLYAYLADGVREEENQETVIISVRDDFEMIIADIVGKRAVVINEAIEGSDGEIPSHSPTPVVTGGIGNLFVRWDGIENHDPVTYEVHLSTDPDFVATTSDDIETGTVVFSDDFSGDLSAWDSVQNVTIEDGRANFVVDWTDPEAPDDSFLGKSGVPNNSSVSFTLDLSQLVDASDDDHWISFNPSLYENNAGQWFIDPFFYPNGQLSVNRTGLETVVDTWTGFAYFRFVHNAVLNTLAFQKSTDGLVWVDVASNSVPANPEFEFGMGLFVDGEYTPDLDDLAVFVDNFVITQRGSGSTLVGTTGATSMSVKTLPNKAPLAYGTTYYVRIIATDEDGSAEQSPAASGVARQATGEDISVDYVYAGNVLADQITGGTIQSDLLMSGSIKTASSGARVELNSDGIAVYEPSGDPTTVLGSDGQSTFKGDVQATRLTVVDGMAIRGTDNELARAGELNLAGAVTSSPNAPTVVVDYDSVGLGVAGVPKSLHRVGSQWLVQHDDGQTRRFNNDGTLHSIIGRQNSDKANYTQINSTYPGYYITTDGKKIGRDLDWNSVDGLRYELNDQFANLSGWTTSGDVSSSSGTALVTNTSGANSSLVTTGTHPFQGRYVQVKAVPNTLLHPSQAVRLTVKIDASNYIQAYIKVDAGVRKLFNKVVTAGVASTSSVAWNNSSNYIRISEQKGIIRVAQTTGDLDSTNDSDLSYVPVGHSFSAAQLNAVTFELSAGDDTASKNAIANPGFETNTTGWIAANSTIARITTQAASGSASCQVTSSAAGWTGVQCSTTGTSAVPVTPGSTITMAAKAKSASVSRELIFTVDWYKADGSAASVGSLSIGRGNTNTSTWLSATYNWTVPVDAAYARFKVYLNSAAAAGEVHYIDDVSVTYPNVSVNFDDVRSAWSEFDWSIPTVGTFAVGSNFMKYNPAQVPSIGTDGTNLLVAEAHASNNTIRVSVIDPFTYKVISVYTSAAVTGFVGPMSGVMIGTFDFGANRIVVKGPTNNYFWVFTYSGSTLTYQPNESFAPATNATAGGAWDGSNFWNAGTDNRLYKHTGVVWTDTGATKTWNGAFTWYDGDSTGGTHESKISPRASFTMKKRARVTVTSPDIPDEGGTDDPDRIRVYLSQTNLGTLYLQTTTAAGVKSAVLTAATFSGTTPPASSNFPSATPAKIKNSDSSLIISGDGGIKARTLELVGPNDPFTYSMHARNVLSGGGSLFGDPSTGSVSWSQRFIVIGAGRNAQAPSGYFNITMPADGTVIPVYGSSVSTRTVSGGLVPLGTWEALYYELPLTDLGTVVRDEKFRIAGYTTDPYFDVPWNWIYIVGRNNDNAAPYTHQWGDGRKTLPHMSRHKTATQSLTSGTEYTIDFNGLDQSQGKITYSAGVFTVGGGGLYNVNAGFHLQSSAASGTIALIIRVNSTKWRQLNFKHDGANVSYSISSTVPCDPGDTIDIRVSQATGAAATLYGVTPGIRYTYCDITYAGA